ncbi:MAG: homocysteine S-methyltransferase family protein, partial [Phycisphaerales bacterium]|nr:homocysteine S-methyltransferase family protein [Phycisphaerales bacterium]
DVDETPILLDGPVGTMLSERGVPTPSPGWSGHAVLEAPEVLASIHEAYRDAGAMIHTANTFRTTARIFDDWIERTSLAVEIASRSGTVAGSIAPIEDCYRPDLSPARRDPVGTTRAFREFAAVLADAGADLLLCETFPCVDEALLALDAALGTSLPVWVSLTTGYRGDLMTAADVATGARRLADAGAAAVLVNCAPLATIPDLLDALKGCGVPFGAYANSGDPNAYVGWTGGIDASDAYAEACLDWVRAGASIVGGCCGTTPAHIRKVASRLHPSGIRPDDHSDSGAVPGAPKGTGRTASP